MSSEIERCLKRKRKVLADDSINMEMSTKSTFFPPTPPGLCGDDDSDSEIVCLGVFPIDSHKKHNVGSSKNTNMENMEPDESSCLIIDDVESPSIQAGSSNLPSPPKEPSEIRTNMECCDDEDNDCVIVEAEKPPTPIREPLPETLETGDDECMVLDGEDASKSREKRVKCTACSETFITHGGMMLHFNTSHKSDVSLADQLCPQDFGIPFNDSISYVCRTCCVAFECGIRYLAHIDKHMTRAGFFQCNYCSGTQVCTKDLDRHHERHHIKNIPDPFKYICVHCTKPTCFIEEGQFINHLAHVHNTPIYTFCKFCGLGCLKGQKVVEHVIRGSCKRQMAPSTLNIGFTVATDLKYEPVNVNAHLTNLKAFPNNFLTLSSCTHRSFIRFGTVFTSCPDETGGKCFGIVNSHRWQTMMAAKQSQGLLDDSYLSKYKMPDSQCANEMNYLQYIVNNPDSRIPPANETKKIEHILPPLRLEVPPPRVISAPPRVTAPALRVEAPTVPHVGHNVATERCFYCNTKIPVHLCVRSSMINTQRLCHQIAYIPEFKTSGVSPTIFSNLMKKIKLAGYKSSGDEPIAPFCRNHFEAWMIGNDGVITSLAMIKVDDKEILKAFCRERR